ncbi:hypothetical protein PQC12_gp100 [Synechococcus phage S-SCSM1]|uniref:Uncharacterized protein n=1 Tax=Synechococcus phage S-SCSM1 TaxID=2588487 RepID=A0A6M2ZIY7_9CAUD|nr:hypothetical protein PQC12_gp100 [Synechococcus phage S-SCSM1]QFG06536.1 hypothetical protein SSCSM1_272 [Synechococcus phage S-SCSM1]
MTMTEQEKDQLAVCKEQGLPNDAELIDDVFYVWETRFGLHSTMTKQGRKMLTGLKKEDVVNMTRWHLQCEQEGTLEKYSRVVGSAIVGGKL